MLQRNLDTLRFLATNPVGAIRTGQTPHTVIFRQGPSSVRHFAPVEAKTAPVLISMPLINTWQIWDLLPEVSLVGALNRAGVPVYLLDWGRPGDEDASRPLAHYVDSVLGRAFDRVKRDAALRYQATAVDAIGYCVGGTFLAAHLARHPDQARRLALVCAPIDFHQSGLLATWASPGNFPLDALIDGVGNYPGDLMKTSFQWLKPSGQTRKWVGLWERIERPEFRRVWAALEQWAGDAVPFPGEAYREYVRRCYFENALMTGGWTMDGRSVDLGNAKIEALAIAAADDHIAAPASVAGLAKAWGGPVELKTIPGGHVAVSLQKPLHDALIGWARP